MRFTQKRDLLLASGSPRRKEFLERYGFNFRILTGEVDETPKQGESPSAFTERMAIEKNRVIHPQLKEGEIVLSADTVVVINDQILGKPCDQKHKIEMLKTLNGNEHEVLTAYTIYDSLKDRFHPKTVSTKVLFQQLPDEWILSYAQDPESDDKAGAYSIQGLGTFLVASIMGSYNNVVGLPIEVLLVDLAQLGMIEIR